ncbi:AMP-binding protein [Polaromonas sp.]|uniref:AMP-binding protein n=1 Tax=Polaromonas sp. TaxID=1869339 RepID=UPI00352B2E19
MPILNTAPVLSRLDLQQFESEMTLEQRLPERCVLDVLVGTARRQPDSKVFTMLMTGAPDEQPRSVTYLEFIGLVHRAANLFVDLAGPRPAVAYMLPSLIETHATLWGAETAGYAVPINFLLQIDHIAELLRASGAQILVALGPHPVLDIWEKALELQKLVPGLKLVRVGAAGTPVLPGVIDFDDALMAQPADRLIFGESCQGDDVAAYFHTGGTTGTPKLAAHTHRGQLVAAMGGAVMANGKPGDISTATLPLFHVGGTIAGTLSGFMSGRHMLIMSPSGLRSPAMVQGFWRIVAQYRASTVGAVPTSIGAILQVPVGDADISCIRSGATGAALLPPAVGARFTEVTGRTLHEVYGMTEASGLIAIDPAGSMGGTGSVGWALPYTRVQVRRLTADGSPGEECKAGEVGVIFVSGPTVSPGYRNPAHDQGVFVNGTLNSGDLGYTDADGRLFMAGRAKDFIIRSGHNIDPVMIENAMTSHPAVALAAAVGMPDAYAGELPVCYVELRPGAQVTSDELRDHAQATIGERPAWPRHFHITDKIPVTAVGKIYKPQLRCDAAARHVTDLVQQQMVCPDAQVKVEVGGKRGLRVIVTMPAARHAQVPAIREALSEYLFETQVVVE